MPGLNLGLALPNYKRGTPQFDRKGVTIPMKKALAFAALMLLQMPAWAQSPSGRELNQPEPPMLGIHWARGANPDAKEARGGAPPFGGGKSPNLSYHNGPILNTTQVVPILWGKKWGGSTADSTFIADKITGLDNFYDGFGGTDYAKTNTEYTSTTSQVTANVANSGHVMDTSAAPTKAPSTSTILNEVCKMIANPQPNGYYPVYTDLKRGSAGYCAWHSWGTCSGVNVQFAFFFNLDGDSGCDPRDTFARTGKPTQGLAALANVSGHELSEAMTDPRGNGWYDSQGYENSDKCAWDFASNYITFSNGSQWKIQGNWSNDSYDKGYGYANDKGQKGCLDGGGVYNLQ
jgi:hypothetical protein